MKTRIEKRPFGDTVITLVIDVDENLPQLFMETKVLIDEIVICYISYKSADEFCGQLHNLTELYRI